MVEDKRGATPAVQHHTLPPVTPSQWNRLRQAALHPEDFITNPHHLMMWRKHRRPNAGGRIR